MCGVKLNEWKKSELRELSGLEAVSLMIKKSRLRWFGHVEQKDDNDWVKRASDSPATYGALQMCFDWLIDW